MGQIWGTNTLGGFMYSDNLSEYLRTKLQPMTRFRQFCDAKDGTMLGENSGAQFFWDVYSDVATQGGALDEQVAMPETNFTITQSSLTVTEYGKLFAALIFDFVDNLCAKVVGFPMTESA